MLLQDDIGRHSAFLGLACLAFCAAFSPPNVRLASPPQGDQDKFKQLREEMVEQQLAHPRDPRPAISNRRVLEAMRRTPRHLFVPREIMPLAYEDSALPIGQDQTISQPYIVAMMTELAEPTPSDRALEVGTGSGYQAAVLASLVAELFTIEIVEPLGVAARERLRALGYKNVEVRIGDGYRGWPEKAPFDIILVTAAAEKMPPALVEQLKPGGRMVIPLHKTDDMQVLTLVQKRSKDPADITIREVLPVRFVPLVTTPRDKN
jgi:protein-L-isoaspartate(D-aspartate) O-methyltransferase